MPKGLKNSPWAAGIEGAAVKPASKPCPDCTTDSKMGESESEVPKQLAKQSVANFSMQLQQADATDRVANCTDYAARRASTEKRERAAKHMTDL